MGQPELAGDLGDAEVEDLDQRGAVAAPHDEQVRRLEIAMDDTAGVRLGDRGAGLDHVADREPGRKRSALDERCEVVALQELHHDVRQAVGRAPDIEHAAHVIGAKAGCRARLVKEAIGDGLIARELGAHHLHRDLLLELEVGRGHDDSHPADPDHSVDSKPPGDDIANLQGRQDNRRLHRMDPVLGTMIDRYRIERVLGEGGMGRVYLGVQPQIGSRVAIKLMSSAASGHVDRFFAEARAVNLIDHDSIVKVTDLGTLPDGRPFIVMEYLEGATLRAVVKDGAPPLGSVGRVIVEVLAALAAVHEREIVHRDLKPDNIFLTVSGRVKVLDFGIAKLLAGRGESAPRTKTGLAIGTPEYMAPEQISGGTIDARTDLYTMGIVLFEAATGRRPFSGETDFALMRAHVEDAPPRPSSLRPEIPALYEQVILQALAKQPELRFQSAAAMSNALSHALAQLPAEHHVPLVVAAAPASGAGRFDATVPVHPEAEPTRVTVDHRGSRPRPEPVAKRRWPIALAALAILGAAGAIAWFATRGPAEPAPIATVELDASAAVADAASVPVDTALLPEDAAVTAVLPDGRPVAGSPRPSTPIDAGVGENRRAPVDASVPAPVPDPKPQTGSLPPPSLNRLSDLPRRTAALDFDPKRFDAVAYTATATKLARSMIPDAALTGISIDGIQRSGLVDLTESGAGARWSFRSPIESKRPRPDGAPREANVYRACHVDVRIDRELRISVDDAHTCTAAILSPPRCTMKQIWARALEQGMDPEVDRGDLRYRESYAGDGELYLNTGSRKPSYTIANDCK